MKEIVGLTMLDTARCFMLYQYALQARNLEGDAAEVGVYKGGSAKLLAHLFQPVKKTLQLFDTFEGMPEVNSGIDLRHRKGDLNDTSLEKVRATLASFPLVQFYAGRFPETVASVKDKKFCFVHIDVDIYTSVLECCNFFYPRMVPNGVMIFDDYSALQCPGVKRALDEFFYDKREKVYYLLTGQGLVWRHWI